MPRKRIFVCLLLLTASILTGCNMRAINELYCLPQRSESYRNLQSQINQVMGGLEYCAPVSGENRQTVQAVDLNGDGVNEYVLFARGNAENPLHLFVFTLVRDEFVLLDTISSTGDAFEQVEYVQIDDRPGMEIVLGRQISNQVVRSVSVYSLIDGQLEQLVTANYAKFVCTDLNQDSRSELLVLRPDLAGSGVAELYGMENGVMERSQEVSMSEPTEAIKRIMVGKLNDGVRAVYVASSINNKAIITDIFAMVNDVFTNVSFSNESGTSVQTLRNYYVYADDIDEDGVLELPDLITLKAPDNQTSPESQYLIRWYAMTSSGAEVDKLYTYHNFVGGWYLQLNQDLVHRLYVSQQGNGYVFGVWNEAGTEMQRLLTVFALTGQKREEQATIDNRFVLLRTESTVYAANLDVASASYGISKEQLVKSFHLILQDWNTGET